MVKNAITVSTSFNLSPLSIQIIDCAITDVFSSHSSASQVVCEAILFWAKSHMVLTRKGSVRLKEVSPKGAIEDLVERSVLYPNRANFTHMTCRITPLCIEITKRAVNDFDRGPYRNGSDVVNRAICFWAAANLELTHENALDFAHPLRMLCPLDFDPQTTPMTVALVENPEVLGPVSADPIMQSVDFVPSPTACPIYSPLSHTRYLERLGLESNIGAMGASYGESQEESSAWSEELLESLGVVL